MVIIVPIPTDAKSMKLAIEAVKEFAGKIIGPALEEVGLTLGDHVRSFRLKRQIQLFLTAQERLNRAGIDPGTIPLRTFVPLLEGASLEDDEELGQKWSGLLASAAAGEKGPRVLPSFPIILRQLTPNDARILDLLMDSRVPDGAYLDRILIPFRVAHPEDFGIAVDGLLGLGLIEVEPSSAVFDGYLNVTDQQGLRISRLGVHFVKACRGPEPLQLGRGGDDET